MKNSNNQEKSRGILAFASNTDVTDYISIATKTLKLAEKTLGLPSTLITNVDSKFTNTRFDVDRNEFVDWKNLDRYLAYDCSPYDETIVIDADYLVLDRSLLNIFEIDWDYILQRSSYSLAEEFPTNMGKNSLPYVWATVFAFRKTPRAKMFFNLVKRIQENYSYYRLLFNIEQRNYRNDYSFAIADLLLNGYTLSNTGIPGNMLSISQPIESLSYMENNLIIRDNTKAYMIPKMNVHIMSKLYLQSENFDRFINEQI